MKKNQVKKLYYHEEDEETFFTFNKEITEKYNGRIATLDDLEFDAAEMELWFKDERFEVKEGVVEYYEYWKNSELIHFGYQVVDGIDVTEPNVTDEEKEFFKSIAIVIGFEEEKLDDLMAITEIVDLWCRRYSYLVGNDENLKIRFWFLIDELNGAVWEVLNRFTELDKRYFGG